MEKITPDQVSNWVTHPITQLLIEGLVELKQDGHMNLEGLVLNRDANDLQQNICKLAQLKGQIQTVDEVLDIKSFILRQIELKEVLLFEDTPIIDGLENL